MSDGLRIRSEALPDAALPQPFLPPTVLAGDPGDGFDDGDFSAFVAGAGQALTQLFGLPVAVLPGRPQRGPAGEAGPRIAPALAGLLATLQLGGDAARAPAVPGQGVATARQARAIAAALDAVAERLWPDAGTLAGYDLEIACGAVAGHAHVPAPPRAAPPPPVPVAALAARLFALPMRVRVELASDMTMVASLLPLRTGTVLPISPSPEMPLVLGDHRIGRATVAPLADGRQQATITAIAIEPLEGRG